MLETETTLSAPERCKASLSSSRAIWQIVAWALAAVVCGEYIAYLAGLQTVPLQDLPNHLARGVVMSDLLFGHGERFGDVYSLSLLPVPYVLHDLILASLVRVFGTQAGGTAFVILAVLAMPLALMFYMWAAELTPRARPALFLIALYLATDSFFLLGFMAFRLSLALLLVTFGLAQRLRSRWSGQLFAIYLLTLVCGYLTHLTATMFFAQMLAVSSFVRLLSTWAPESLRRRQWFLGRTTTWQRELALWIPLLVLIALHVLLTPRHSADNPETYQFFWGTWAKKLQHLTFEYTRFGTHLDYPLMLLLMACLLWPLRRYLQINRFLQASVLEPLLIAAAFLGVFFVLPQYYSDSAYVDVRALPVVLLMVMLACLNIPGAENADRAFGTWIVFGLALLLSLANLGYLMRHFGKYETMLNQYRALGDTIPEGSYVLPVHTQHKDGEIRPMLHAAGYAVADRQAVIPYLFSGDHGDPMKYFRYHQRPYWPEEEWYTDRQSWDRAVEQSYTVGGRVYTWRFARESDTHHWKLVDLVPIDWNRVACRYDYILMTKPVDLSLIETPVRQLRENAAATLLAVDKSACRPADLIDNKAVRLSTEH